MQKKSFVCVASLLYLGVLGHALGQQTTQVEPSVTWRQLGMSGKEALQGWIALFDGVTDFGFVGSSLVTSGEQTILRGGATTTEFIDYEIRAQVTQGGTIKLSGTAFTVKPGALTLTSRGRRGVVELGPNVGVASLLLRPVDLQTLFDGKTLTGWREKFNPKLAVEKRARWCGIL